MKVQSYDELLHSKYRLSLMLFLFLNTAISLFFLFGPSHNAVMKITPPGLLIPGLSLALLLWAFLKSRSKLPLLNAAAFIIGILWAWHISLKYSLMFYFDGSYLLVSLISIFFVSSIALGDHLLAFCLHSVPPAITILVLDQGHNLLMLLFTIALPLLGFTLHHLMQRRSDGFIRRLMSQLNEEKETFSDLSMLDPLTGLYNRRGLKNRLANVLKNHSGSHFVLLLDIDHFKAYNDNYGHAMGDRALARVSVAIRNAVRSRDIVTRYGGEEFLVLLTNVNAPMAMKLAERIRQYVIGLAIPHRFNEQVSPHVTISAGIAPLFENDFDQALAKADRALYLAKSQGRNAIICYEAIAEPNSPQSVDMI
ncbi:diguanylate cyclase [[Pantoea] beijingensis]|uniref:diguanylate cyclase n=1 Tax=[Pantoea] beijingensis TaxID=1324864 RepID=A0A443IAA9_9GAMM|nr:MULTISPECIES: diguanylate cyclase [Erwiniaceae]RWR00920.1 diguanylate cyclase [[Pantoea] beijingensis]